LEIYEFTTDKREESEKVTRDKQPATVTFAVSSPHDRRSSVKAYLIITGTVFGLIAVLHVLRAIAERQLLTTQPGSYLAMTSLTFVAAGLSLWAWLLLLRRDRPAAT
jgi:hypothetical protein